MRVPKCLRLFTIALMSLILTNVPALAMAEGQMISTSAVAEEMNRAQAEQKVRDYLQMSEVRAQLEKNGVSADEVSQRVANLSERELKQLAGQMDQARAGGDILITVLLVVLIIFLVKRI